MRSTASRFDQHCLTRANTFAVSGYRPTANHECLRAGCELEAPTNSGNARLQSGRAAGNQSIALSDQPLTPGIVHQL